MIPYLKNLDKGNNLEITLTAQSPYAKKAESVMAHLLRPLAKMVARSKKNVVMTKATGAHKSTMKTVN